MLDGCCLGLFFDPEAEDNTFLRNIGNFNPEGSILQIK
jgi:hypothetical protein